MEDFVSLLEVAHILNSPEGCPWDREQTFQTLREYVLEESHELLEAVDADQDEQIIEELGDLFYTVIFYGKIAERENRFSIQEIIKTLREKLIRRHPHVFGKETAESMDDVIRHWDAVKGKENEKKGRESALDGIPVTLPSLQKAQKMLKRIKKFKGPTYEEDPQTQSEELATKILEIIREANEADIDLESAFREKLSREEKHFRDWELQTF